MKEKEDMTFLEHLEELRWHIIRSVIAIVSFSIIAFIFKEFLFDTVLMGPGKHDFWTNDMLKYVGDKLNMDITLNKKALMLQNTAMAGQFVAHIKISLITGLVFGFPYLFFEFWNFIKPALYQNERRHASGAIFFITFLFLLGVLFGYFLIVPFSVNFLYNYQTSEIVRNIPTLASYVSLVTSIVLVSGILFELPVLIYFLSQIGLVTPAFLKRYRKHSFVVILLVAGIITPTPDMFTQLIVSLPMILLYEVGIILSRRVEKKKTSIIPAG